MFICRKHSYFKGHAQTEGHIGPMGHSLLASALHLHSTLPLTKKTKQTKWRVWLCDIPWDAFSTLNWKYQVGVLEKNWQYDSCHETEKDTFNIKSYLKMWAKCFLLYCFTLPKRGQVQIPEEKCIAFYDCLLNCHCVKINHLV